MHPEQSRRMLIQSGCRRNLDSYDGQKAPKPSRVAPLDPSGPRDRTGRGAGQLWCPARPCDGRAWGPEYGEAARQRRRQNPGGGAPRSRQSPAGEPGSHPLSSHRQNGDTCRETDRQGRSLQPGRRRLPRALPGTQKGQAGQEAPGGGHGLAPESQVGREKGTS